MILEEAVLGNITPLSIIVPIENQVTTLKVNLQFCSFETGSHYIALTVLELAM